MKTCCGYSLEAPHRGASNEYPQHMFSWRNRKNIFLILFLSRAVKLLAVNHSLKPAECSNILKPCSNRPVELQKLSQVSVMHSKMLAEWQAVQTLIKLITLGPGPEVIKCFSCSTQLSMEFVSLLNLKIFFKIYFMLNSAEHAQLS